MSFRHQPGTRRALRVPGRPARPEGLRPVPARRHPLERRLPWQSAGPSAECNAQVGNAVGINPPRGSAAPDFSGTARHGTARPGPAFPRFHSRRAPRLAGQGEGVRGRGGGGLLRQLRGRRRTSGRGRPPSGRARAVQADAGVKRRPRRRRRRRRAGRAIAAGRRAPASLAARIPTGAGGGCASALQGEDGRPGAG